ncbi:EAL domain-containing protein [Ferrimonas gelatinilytica]|uniref:RNase E specificity factor CsrD n=1 Tax=Ferrimonas gelatinilytica TaxID=1255257 RepID=A0ABP9SFN2_9GAMM
MKKNRTQTQRLIQFWITSLLFITLSLLISAWTASYSHSNHNREVRVNALVKLMNDQSARGVTLEQMEAWLPDLLEGLKADRFILLSGERELFRWQPRQYFERPSMHFRRQLDNGLTLKVALKRPQLLPTFSRSEWLVVGAGLMMALGMVLFGRRWLRGEMAGVELLALRARRINDGEYEAAGSPVRGERPLVVGRAMQKLHRQWRRERSAKLELDRQIRANASLDPELGLGNRLFFESRLASLAPDDQLSSHGLLCLLQFDGLEPLDSQSRLVLLQEFIDHCDPILMAHPDAVFARLEALQLGLVVPVLPLKEADALVARLHRSAGRLSLPGEVERDRLLHLGAAYFVQGESLEQALEEADQALRAAQLQGESGWFMYDKGAVDRELAQGSVRWRSLLEGAIRRGDFLPQFEDVVNAEGKVIAREMVSQIRDGQGTLLAASLYRPMARRCGLLPMIDRELLALALRQQREHGWPEPVTVNLPFESVIHPRFGKSIKMLLANYQARRSQLIIEVNERELVQYADQMIPTLRQWQKMGVQLSVDGVGYTVEGTHYIDDLSLHWLKLHPSLVHQIDRRPDSQLVVTSLRQVVSHHPIQVVAAGVQTEAERRCLLQLGVSALQGSVVATGRKAG